MERECVDANLCEGLIYRCQLPAIVTIDQPAFAILIVVGEHVYSETDLRPCLLYNSSSGENRLLHTLKKTWGAIAGDYARLEPCNLVTGLNPRIRLVRLKA